MTKPNVKLYIDDPAYLRCLVDASGLSQDVCARSIGHSPRAMRYWFARTNSHQFAYSIQYTLEELIGPEAVNRARSKYFELQVMPYFSQ